MKTIFDEMFPAPVPAVKKSAMDSLNRNLDIVRRDVASLNRDLELLRPRVQRLLESRRKGYRSPSVFDVIFGTVRHD